MRQQGRLSSVAIATRRMLNVLGRSWAEKSNEIKPDEY
jgi:hypothetical protein